MDFIDLVWDEGNEWNQERQLGEVREQIERMRLERDLTNWDLRKIKELAGENVDLKLRLGLLVRLLIAKGIITAPEYAALIAEARPKS